MAVPFTRDLLLPQYWLTWLGLGFAGLISVLSQRGRHRIGAAIGNYLYRNNQKRTQVARTNLGNVFPMDSSEQLEDKVKSHLQWYGKGLVEYSLFFFGSRKRLLKLVSTSGEQCLAISRERDQAIILLLAHSVMLEFAAIALASKQFNSFGSYKRSKNPVLDWMIARSRCRFVDFVVSREAGLRPLIKAIQSKKVMIFLPDEDLGLDNAVFAPFFNRQKATLTTPARLCRLGKAVAVAGFVAFDDETQQFQLNLQELPVGYPLNDKFQDAQNMNQAFEKLILQHPTQYMWLMKLYKTTHPEDEPIY